MRERLRAALIVLAGLTPIALGFLLDDYVDPLLIWGGRICQGNRRLSRHCMVPPYLLITTSVLFAIIAERILDSCVYTTEC